MIDTRVRIETPESVWLTFRLAGPWIRMKAYLVDLGFRIGFTFFVAMIVSVTAPLFSISGLPFGFMLLYIFFLEWGYTCLFEAFWNGKTPGKHFMCIRTIKVEGSPIGFYDSMLRNLVRAADVLPILYGVGLLSMLVTRNFQRLGDLMAGTLVVHEDRAFFRTTHSDLHKVEPISRVHLETGYRPPDRILDLIDTLFRRQWELPPKRINEIASILAKPLADRMGYIGPDEEHHKAPVRFLFRVLATFSPTQDSGKEERRPSPRSRWKLPPKNPKTSREGGDS